MYFLNNIVHEKLIKDVVQPEKRGLKRGTNRSTSYKSADVFLGTGTLKGLLAWFKLEKTGHSI
jgi:hypothetical protein